MVKKASPSSRPAQGQGYANHKGGQFIDATCTDVYAWMARAPRRERKDDRQNLIDLKDVDGKAFVKDGSNSRLQGHVRQDYNSRTGQQEDRAKSMYCEKLDDAVVCVASTSDPGRRAIVRDKERP